MANGSAGAPIAEGCVCAASRNPALAASPGPAVGAAGRGANGAANTAACCSMAGVDAAPAPADAILCPFKAGSADAATATTAKGSPGTVLAVAPAVGLSSGCGWAAAAFLGLPRGPGAVGNPGVATAIAAVADPFTSPDVLTGASAAAAVGCAAMSKDASAAALAARLATGGWAGCVWGASAGPEAGATLAKAGSGLAEALLIGAPAPPVLPTGAGGTDASRRGAESPTGASSSRERPEASATRASNPAAGRRASGAAGKVGARRPAAAVMANAKSGPIRVTSSGVAQADPEPDQRQQFPGHLRDVRFPYPVRVHAQQRGKTCPAPPAGRLPFAWLDRAAAHRAPPPAAWHDCCVHRLATTGAASSWRDRRLG